ncbi:hypothetical protein FRC12_008976 [Ceratobasidium sp. 428]|nr:hypothetical protein FRC12_008976 [Ceratobasidium sp. 428]
MKYHLSPSFHIATHTEDSIFKYGGARNTWCFPFERGNKYLINTNHNGHGLGTLETTMLCGYLKKVECIRILRHLQALPNPTNDDKATIKMMLESMRTGPEREVYREMLGEVLAGEAAFQGQENICFASNPAKVDLQVAGHCNLICEHINSIQDDFVVFAGGRRPERGVRLSSKNSTLSHAHLEHRGVRFGVAGHAHGDNARFGYIRGNIPVIIRRIYRSSILFPGEDEPRQYTTVLVQRFSRHATHPHPRFPWNRMNEYTRIEPWAVDTYEDLEAVPPEDLTGTFALYPIELSHGPYWLTIAMKPAVPTQLD